MKPLDWIIILGSLLALTIASSHEIKLRDAAIVRLEQRINEQTRFIKQLHGIRHIIPGEIKE